jgi:hypothetical protein
MAQTSRSSPAIGGAVPTQSTFTVETATTWLTKAETAIADFLQTSRTERSAIAILTLVRTR